MARDEIARPKVILDGQQAEAELDKLTQKANKYRDAMLAAAKAGDSQTEKRMAANFKKATTEISNFKKEAFSVEAVLKKINGASFNEIAAASRKATADLKKMQQTDPGYAEQIKNVKTLKSKLAELNQSNRSTMTFWEKMRSSAKDLLPVLGVAAVFAGAKQLVGNIIAVRKEFEKYEAVLSNTLGSNKAARKEMQMLQDFAAETPFALTELTGAFVKLTNYGLQPSREEIRKYGDIASSVGKGFDQFAEAMADAVTGEFERLKEFGIKAKKEGDKITFTFKEQSTVVDNNATSIKNYISGLGNLQGVAGSMAAIAGTLGGKMSNMGDAWDGFLNTLGSGTSGIMTTVIGWLTSFVQNLDGAFISISNIKNAVSDKSTIDAMNNALMEIDIMTKSLVKNGMTQGEAHKRAVDLYTESMINAMKRLNESRKEGTAELKQQLVNELNAVKTHFKKVDELKAQQNKTANEKRAADRLKNSQAVAAFLTKDAQSQKDAINKYFHEAGEDAFDEFMKAIEAKQASGKVDFSILPEKPGETEKQDPALDYASQKYQESIEYQLLLNETLHENGLRGEQEYQDELTRLNQEAEDKRNALRAESIEKAQQLAQLGVNFVSALMDMELAAAGDNEEKKAAIRKKYARVQFLVSASQIIVDTAGAIMKALAQLGPIGGAIAAGIIGATGAVQLATAYQQANSVEGYAAGGYTNGDRIYRAGEEGVEFIGNAKSVRNPSVRRIFDIVNLAQQNGTIATINLPAVLNARGMMPTGRQSSVYTSKLPEQRSGSNGGEWGGIGIDAATAKELTDAIKAFNKKKLVIYTEQVKKDLDEWENISNNRGL